MFDYTFRIVLIGGALLGLVCGVLGSLVVIRRQSLIGDAISHATLPGLVLAYLFAGRRPEVMLAGAALSSVVGIAAVHIIHSYTRIKHEAAMGIVLSGFFAVGLALLGYIQKQQDASAAVLRSFLLGQAAALVRQDIFVILGLAILVLIFVCAFWRQFLLISFDQAFARSLGIAVLHFNACFMLLVVLTVVIALQLAGVLLVLGLFIAPGIAARQWTTSLSGMALLAGGMGATAAAIAAVLSASGQNLPTGPMIIVVLSVFVAVSLLFAPKRGIFAK